MTTKEYQNIIHPLIQTKLEGLEVKNEWTAFTGYRNHYSPRVDIAVGPFSMVAGQNQTNDYNQLVATENINLFIRKLYHIHIENIGLEVNNEITIPPFEELIYKNQNARCFLAIEIENENSKKHIMGSLINAASLGRIGIGVAYTEKTMRTFIRIMNYLGFLRRVEKNTYDTTNFLIISKNQMQNIFTEINDNNG
ncbi:hypothetical protein [Flavihumibacter profundi]|uniref:hypothetical protein n=1 Tax=Flavihumibacter profundi TaxID=2716883 RepID=UPI001CC7FC5B|nr:hypothetical protein [Flavihumibacter profundi]MBZ5859081.1 hypothetical protein [Flavihumibacter profundi]